jgi:hypothetical protein
VLAVSTYARSARRPLPDAGGTAVNAASLVRALARAAPRFSAGDRRAKLRLLEALRACHIRQPGVLAALHETLCFLQAYPDDARVLEGVDEGLAGMAARVKRLGPAARALGDTGIAGTALDHPFGLPMARWLASRFPAAADVRWDKLRRDEPLQETLPILAERAEEDAVTDEGGLGWREWLRRAKGVRSLTDLELLVELFDRAPLGADARDRLFESLALPIGWRLGAPSASRTLARLPWPRPFFHGGARGAFIRPDARAFAHEVRRPLPALRRAPRALARDLIEAARVAMATRLRELFAFAHANPDDVLVADPGRGLRIALIGILPRQRLAYHGYYAYLALKNGVPVSYGAGWQLFGDLEAAVNVFESFRRGESAFIVAQVMRAYRQALGTRTIVVDPYQIGLDNPEALASGAFYFYRRLGFRPRDADVRRIAETEEARIAARPGYRSSLAVLAQLARSEIYLPLGRDDGADARPLTASRLAALVTRDVARRFGGDRATARRRAAARVARALEVTGWSRWTADEQRGFAQLALLVGQIPDLARWPRADRRRLAALMRARGGASEARYTRALGAHARLRESLLALVRQAPAAV